MGSTRKAGWKMSRDAHLGAVEVEERCPQCQGINGYHFPGCVNRDPTEEHER